MTNSCIFCKIARGDLPAYKIYEDADFIALLDLFPLRTGQSLVIPRAHVTSNFSSAPAPTLTKLMTVGQRVASRLEAQLPSVERTIAVIEGLELDHLHLKLYPVASGQGGITKGGERAQEAELKRIHELLTLSGRK